MLLLDEPADDEGGLVRGVHPSRVNHPCCLRERDGSGRRSVRLRKGFVNVERAPFGGLKLRIPTMLFVEKMRTQSRFNVNTAFCLRGGRCGSCLY